ncbi:response regulator transcription factor [Anaerocolumna sp.]|uniref:response regulator transcription factor n=1 Tax=Anaerocolumna sp. TaxID=2041569 RepID=UPI0028A83A59|nr:response regulator transcription factor [Anaerocolumna sp.]
MNNKILVIDDDKELCTLIQKYAGQENLHTDVAYTGTDGLKKAGENTYQLIVIDVMLPELDGFSLLSEIRKASMVPILMLTAKSGEQDKVKGLRIGADDYLTKPFSINELTARIISLVRRYTTLNPSIVSPLPTITLKNMTIDTENRIVSINEIPVELTGKEFDLLFFFASNPGRIFTKRQVYTNVWEDDYAFDDNNIMSFISKLRKKIEPNANNPFYIQTVRGVGYRFNKEASL